MGRCPMQRQASLAHSVCSVDSRAVRPKFRIRYMGEGDMTQVQCGVCYGSGQQRCHGCSGRGSISRMSLHGVEMSPCAVCGGRGRHRCEFCSGTGKIGTPDVPAPSVAYPLPAQPHQPSPHPTQPATPPPPGLKGKWVAADGSWYQFDGDGPEYALTAGSATGTARGSALLEGDEARLVFHVPLLGPLEILLRVQGEELSGTMNVMGVLVPMSFRRVWWPN